MKRPAFVVVVLSLLLVTPASHGQEKIKKGVSEKAAKALREAAAVSARDFAQERFRAIRTALARLQRDVLRERAAVEAQLDRQPGYPDYLKKLDAIAAKYGNRRLAPEELRAATKEFIQLNEANADLFKKAVEAARIDERRVQNALASALRPILGKFKLTRCDLGWCFEPVDEPAPEPTPVTAFCLTPPYETVGTHRHSDNIVFVNNATATASDGRVDLEGWAHFLGDAWNDAEVGSFITVPAGFTRLKVTAKIDLSYDFYALSAPGIGYAGGDAMVELVGLDNERERHSRFLGFAISPLLWFARDNGQDLVVVTHTFTVPNEGGEFLIRAGASSYFGAGLNAFGEAFINGTVEEICVELLP